MPYTIVVGNEKGGSGKSTTSMHLVTALMRAEFSVGALDLDLRQRTLTRYLENRKSWSESAGVDLPLPKLIPIEPSKLDTVSEAQKEEDDKLAAAFEELSDRDFIVVDSPGSDTFISRKGHTYADTILTPMNDSFVDFDLLARLDDAGENVVGPSLYSEMVWEARKRRALSGRRQAIDWVVMRNRLGSANARNKRKVGDKLDELASRIGFRLAPGFGERVIYREMFPIGLTLVDLGVKPAPLKFTMSHVAARQEVRNLLTALQLPGVEPQALPV